MAKQVAMIVLCLALVVSANENDTACILADERCISLACFPKWIEKDALRERVLAACMLFFATFLPRFIVRLVIYLIARVRSMELIMKDFGQHCTGTTTYIVSASLVWGAIRVSNLQLFLCRTEVYIWGVFFLRWIYSIFSVLQHLCIRRLGGVVGDFSKQVVITESVKFVRLVVLVIVAAIIYLQAFSQHKNVLMYSVFGMVSLSIALGSITASSNALGGIYLVFHSPFKVGEFVEIEKVQGTVRRVALRYTVLVTMEGTTTYIPNNFFLRKPMPDTPVHKIRKFISELQDMLQTLHIGLTSHRVHTVDNFSATQNDDDGSSTFFVAMDELFKVRIYTFTQEMDPKHHALIKSEVWIAVVEIMEDLAINGNSQESTSQKNQFPINDDTPFLPEFDAFDLDSF